MREISPFSIAEMMVEATASYHPDDLAYLFATGLSENVLRDALSAYMHRTLGLDNHQFVGREWKKTDITIHDGAHPLAFIEGKAYLHKDAADPGRLKKNLKSIKRDLEKDIAKSRKALNEILGKDHGAKNFFTVALSTTHIPDDYHIGYGNITYAKYHREWFKKLGTPENVIIAGNKELINLLSAYGTVEHVRLKTGNYSGIPVTVDFFVLDVRD